MSVLQNKRVRIGIGVAAVVAAVAAIGVGTFAAFNDTEAGPTGSIASGTLDLTVGGTGTTELFAETNIAPGFTRDVTVTVNNVGSIPGTLTSTISTVGADVTCTEPEYEAEGVAAGACAAGGNLQSQMTVQVVSSPGVTTPTTPVNLNTFTTLPAPGAPIAAGGSGAYVLRFALPNLPGTTNNIVQGDRVTVTSNFVLTQA